MEVIATKRTLDRRGKTITTSVVFDAAAELETMDEGEVLELFTDDFEPFEKDIAAWCQATGQVLLSSEKAETGLRFLIERRTPKTKDTRLAIIISADGLDELLSPLGFALAPRSKASMSPSTSRARRCGCSPAGSDPSSRVGLGPSAVSLPRG